jgi:hypothetical protein
VVSCLSEEYAKLFRYEGARTDKHVREHEVYAVESLSNVPTPQTLSNRKSAPAAANLEKQPENSDRQKVASTVKINPLSATKRFVWNRKFLYGP